MAKENTRRFAPTLSVRGRVRHHAPRNIEPPSPDQKDAVDKLLERRGRAVPRTGTLKIPRRSRIRRTERESVSVPVERTHADLGATLKIEHEYAASRTVAEMVHVIDAVTELSLLDQIEEAERSRNKPRKTVLERIDSRRQELSDAGEENE